MYANVRSLDIVAGHQERQLALKAEQKAFSCSSQTQLFRREEADSEKKHKNKCSPGEYDP